MDQLLLKNLLPEFIKALEKKGRSPSTIIAYRADLEQFVDFAEKRQKPYIQSVGSELIENFRDSLWLKIHSQDNFPEAQRYQDLF